MVCPRPYLCGCGMAVQVAFAKLVRGQAYSLIYQQNSLLVRGDSGNLGPVDPFWTSFRTQSIRGQPFIVASVPTSFFHQLLRATALLGVPRCFVLSCNPLNLEQCGGTREPRTDASCSSY
jgi:hypothetical protein